jgi:hypothetical protein
MNKRIKIYTNIYERMYEHFSPKLSEGVSNEIYLKTNSSLLKPLWFQFILAIKGRSNGSS